MSRLRAERGNRCQLQKSPRCLKDYGLEFAHVKPTGVIGRGRGLSRRYLDIKQNPDCYVLACRACHKLLEWETALQRREEAQAS